MMLQLQKAYFLFFAFKAFDKAGQFGFFKEGPAAEFNRSYGTLFNY